MMAPSVVAENGHPTPMTALTRRELVHYLDAARGFVPGQGTQPWQSVAVRHAIARKLLEGMT